MKKWCGKAMAYTIAFPIMVLSAGCVHTARNAGDMDKTLGSDSIQAGHDMTAEARLWADSVISTMTIEEMAGQLIMPAVYSDDSPESMRLLRQYVSDCHVGGVVLLKGTARAARTIADTLRRLMPTPPFVAIDAEWGLAMRLDSTPEFPRNGHLNPSADDTVMFDYGYEVARECREIGINVVLGPVLDVLPPGRRASGIGSRSFGTDASRVACLGVAYAKGLEAGGVISVAKHFPGHGSADADSHKRLPEVSKTPDQLEATDLLPFREYIANGLGAVMTGHLKVPALDPDGRPVTVSERVLKDILRDQMEFDGLILTDAINMAGASGHSAADAITAGADIVLAPADTRAEISAIVEAVKGGGMPVAVLRDRAARVLFHKYMTARADEGSGAIANTEEAERIIKLLR